MSKCHIVENHMSRLINFRIDAKFYSRDCIYLRVCIPLCNYLFQTSSKGKRKEQVTKLLNVLPLRGATAFEKFCDSLQLAGHVFVAELLRDEGTLGHRYQK